MRKAAILATLLLLAACGRGEDENMPTAEEAQALNEAAAMLDASPDSLVAAEDAEIGSGEVALNATETGEEETLDNEQ